MEDGESENTGKMWTVFLDDPEAKLRFCWLERAIVVELQQQEAADAARCRPSAVNVGTRRRS